MRLILISNRVAIPTNTGAHRAGGLEVALAPTLKRYEGVWFGWSGNVVPRDQVRTEVIHKASQTYVLTDLSEEDHQEFYSGFANRVLWPILHYRIDLAEFTRRDLTGYLRVTVWHAWQGTLPQAFTMGAVGSAALLANLAVFWSALGLS